MYLCLIYLFTPFYVPSDASHRPLIDPSEVAIIESMMNGGRELNFKAHFISQLPDLSPLSHTLTHLNLSFNNFTVSAATLNFNKTGCSA